tara:strand:- start:162 stop:356 length:195 start_codon:yes stop_codon:yes gene_type:complete
MATKDRIAIIRISGTYGTEILEKKFVNITTDPEKWIVDHNSMRDEEDHEKLSDFDIEWVKIKFK